MLEKPVIRDLMQIFRHKSLIRMLVAKELKARYRGTFFGFLWSFLNPFLAMLTYVLVFSVYMKVPMENYSAFLLSGLLPWLWFSSAANEASYAILSNGGLIKKIYLPLEIFPLVYVISNLINFLFSLPILLCLLLFLNIKIGPFLLILPLLISIQFLFTLGIALFTSSVTVKFRDFIYIIPNIITIWYFLTPIMYPVSVIPDKFNPLVWLNPFSYLATAYQDIFFYNKLPSLADVLRMAVISVAALSVGILIFQRLKESFPEEV